MPIESCHLHIRVANGGTTTTLGRIRFPIQINGQSLIVNCYVLSKASYPLILGCDFLREKEVSVHFRASGTTIQLSASEKEREEEPEIKIFSLTNTDIPAYSQ